MDEVKEYDPIKRLQQNLVYYRKKRARSLYAIKDLFRNNTRDANSKNSRFNATDALIQAIDRYLTNPTIQHADSLLTLMLSITRKIADKNSTLRKLTLNYFRPVSAYIGNTLGTQEAPVKLKHHLVDYHKLLLNDIVAEREKNLRRLAIIPSGNWRERIRNFFKPKPKDIEIEKLQVLKQHIQKMEGSTVLRNMEKIQSAKTVSDIETLLAIKTTAPSPAEKRRKKTDYFKKKFTERFNAHSMTAIISSTSSFIHQASNSFAALNVFFAIVPGGSIGCNLMRVSMAVENFLEDYQGTKVSAQISLDDLTKNLGGKIAEKLVLRYAYQIGMLYHEAYSTDAITRLVHAMVKNALDNLHKTTIDTVIDSKLTDELQRLKPEDPRYKDIMLDILSERCAQAIGLNFSRMPLSGYMGSYHLMHENDTSIVGGKKMSTFGALSEHGYVVVDEITGKFTFYTGHGLKPEKYGFVFAKKAEVEHLHLRETSVDNDTKSHYQKLYNEFPQKVSIENPLKAIEDRLALIEKQLQEKTPDIEALRKLFQPLQAVQQNPRLSARIAKLEKEMARYADTNTMIPAMGTFEVAGTSHQASIAAA